MVKRLTITYTRDDLNTLWYWQVPSRLEENTMNQYIQENQDKIEQSGYFAAQGYKNIITLTFADEQTYQEWVARVETNVVPGYIQYCQENNITYESVLEDI
jgi:hypothetical protein